MSMPRTVQGCRWSEPTLFLVGPLWMAAEDYPWSCHRDGPPRHLPDTVACAACGRWEGRDADDRRIPGNFPRR
jgi:hypothetical protein